MSPVLTREVDGATVYLTLNRPEALNDLNRELVDALRDELRLVRNDDSVKVVVITGAGDTFSGGADGVEAATLVDDPNAFLSWLANLGELLVEIENLPQPVIAAVNGLARRGGLELALACDFIVASDRAQLGDWHAAKGFFPAAGATQRLPDAVGTRMARRLIYSGELLTASRVEAIGLVQGVFEAGQFAESVALLAEDLASRPRVSLVQAKHLTASSHVSAAALDAERSAAVILRMHPEVVTWKSRAP